jgi:TonB family protein
LSTEPPQEIQSAPVVDTRQGTPSAEPNNNEKQAEEKNQSTVAEAGAQQTSEIRASEVRQGSISVEASRYPSIHITPELKEAAARSGATLQIGEPVSRVEPVYPEDAERQGIEGTVKLRVLITRDGAVQSVQVVSGPSLLAGAAVNAVRQWRYQPTLLGDQPVEIAQDITVVFRIPGTSIAN